VHQKLRKYTTRKFQLILLCVVDLFFLPCNPSAFPPEPHHPPTSQSFHLTPQREASFALPFEDTSMLPLIPLFLSRNPDLPLPPLRIPRSGTRVMRLHSMDLDMSSTLAPIILPPYSGPELSGPENRPFSCFHCPAVFAPVEFLLPSRNECC